MPADPFRAALRAAVKGLTYESESDAPVEPFRWSRTDVGESLTAETVSALAQTEEGAVEEQSLDEFFAPLINEETWHRAKERKRREKFKGLLEILKANLEGLRVFKVGETEKKVFVVGKTKDGDWSGVQTTAVET